MFSPNIEKIIKAYTKIKSIIFSLIIILLVLILLGIILFFNSK